MPFSDPFTSSGYQVRRYIAGDETAMFTVTASLDAAEASDLLAWTTLLEDALDAGGAAWVAARGKRVSGYAMAAPVPGLPNLFELTGGVVPPWQLRGIGTRLLAAVKAGSQQLGATRLSCYVVELAGDTGQFLLSREFYIEHEECLLEIDLEDRLSPVVDVPGVALTTLPRAEAIELFPQIYEQSFQGTPWSQPYSTAEVAALLQQPEDLLFAVKDGQVIGAAWIESGVAGDSRIEPFGIIASHQGQGFGRWLLQAALQRLQERGLQKAQIGLWRTNAAALNLYKGAGFVEVSNWYYLAYDLPSGQVLKNG